MNETITLETLRRLVCEHARMMEDTNWSKDNPAKMTYYGLLNACVGQSVVGEDSGNRYIIRGIGFHPDETGKYRESFCPGFVLTDTGHVHLNELRF